MKKLPSSLVQLIGQTITWLSPPPFHVMCSAALRNYCWRIASLLVMVHCKSLVVEGAPAYLAAGVRFPPTATLGPGGWVHKHYHKPVVQDELVGFFNCYLLFLSSLPSSLLLLVLWWSVVGGQGGYAHHPHPSREGCVMPKALAGKCAPDHELSNGSKAGESTEFALHKTGCGKFERIPGVDKAI